MRTDMKLCEKANINLEHILANECVANNWLFEPSDNERGLTKCSLVLNTQ